jgi:peptidoglycan lytic transglycosylase G
MVEQGVPLSESPSRQRPRPSRGRIAARRALALVVLVGGLALAVWLVVSALGSVGGGDDKVAKPAAPVAPPVLKIIFPEGFTREEMAARIKAVNQIARNKRKINPRLSSKAYLTATASSKIPATFAKDAKRRSLEGFLFPSTYQFEPRTTSRQLVNRQLQAFEENWGKVDLAYAKSKHLTPYDVLIIASLVEKEVIAPEERALVAAVIYNRLKAGMNLGIDATTRYGLHVPPNEPLRQSQLDSFNPYNTRNRQILGLTPTPIANPGLASMQAAAHPAKADYLFFVRKPDKKHHFFTASEAEFDAYLAAHGYG